MKTIWFDIDNSPHVLLFRPIIEILKSEGYNIIVTSRNFAQTLPLLEKYNIPYIRVDGHGGKNKIKKVFTTIKRAYGLYKVLKTYKIDLMVNHGARAGIIAARMLDIPIISAFDYEHTELLLIKLFSDRIIIPSVLRGLFSGSKFYYYNGLKEEIYLCDFKPDNSFLLNFPFDTNSDKPLVTIRPPASHANYHNKSSEIIYNYVLKYVLQNNCNVVLVPRTNVDISAVQNLSDNIYIPSKPLDGPNLVFYSDLVISGGGTMVREAAVLGTPAYSIFTGKPASIDIELVKQGKLTFIRTLADVTKIKIQKKRSRELVIPNTNVRDLFIKIILEKIN
ncbi:DUF354 domain-containing protein [Candidatus Chrysopegis kryptomonas]|uniref:DUF354 domain-containing protein n=1 Tax=Candidatus Chryseopegocella kryptomonas TaxID=1633643 RepID=A0A0N7MX92_9BACT|nr:DUF354 domain-containing protein [Candidatus Chrysopegis kryptomonas]CUT00795.1 hypothetical protein JGI23_00921 [Candidatus Chrysopegis kryptomonas]